MSQTNTLWEINGQSFEFDLQDADTAEKYENAFADMGEREKVLPKDGKPSEYIKAYHKMFVSLYDDVLGDGCGVKIVGEKANARICNEAYESFLEFVAKQKASTMEQQNNLINKFSPNRAQRRANEKK